MFLLLLSGTAALGDEHLKIKPDLLKKKTIKNLESQPTPGPALPVPAAKPIGKALKLLTPTKITGMLAIPPTITSQANGQANINIKVMRTGKMPCKVKVIIDNLNSHPHTWINYTSGDGNYKNGTIVAPRPGKFELASVTMSPKPSDYCSGKVYASVEVKPHAQFPCSLYPGFKKEKFGVMWNCAPSTPPITSTLNYQYLCQPGTTFKSYFGLIFGCFAPGWSP
jgi:hypothetical protein